MELVLQRGITTVREKCFKENKQGAYGRKSLAEKRAASAARWSGGSLRRYDK